MKQDVIIGVSADAEQVALDADAQIKSIHSRMVEDVVEISRQLNRPNPSRLDMFLADAATRACRAKPG